MTDEILSQEEIDALLHGNGKEKGRPEEKGVTVRQQTIEPYDFTKGGVVVKRRIPALEMVHERFARLFRLALFGFLRRPAQVSVKRYDFLRFEDYVHNLPLPAAVNVIRIRPISGMSLFIMNARLVSQFVEIFFNGGGRFYPRVEGRDFSAVDQRIIQLVMEHVFTSLQEAWSPLLRTKVELVGFETNPFFANVAAPSDIVITTVFEVEFDAGGGEVHIVIPSLVLDPIQQLFESGFRAETTRIDDHWHSVLRQDVEEATVHVRASLGKASLSLRDVLALKVGDVIPLIVPESIEAEVEGVPLIRVTYGKHKHKRALKIIEWIKKERTTLEPFLSEEEANG
jgi:flagellar motor switch protein FliM